MTETRSITARLLAPARKIDVRTLAAGWFMGRVRLTISGFAPDVPLPALAGRVRGALGAALQNSASADAICGKPCPWSPPCALDILYRTQGRITPGLEIPKPYTISIERVGEDGLVVELSLLGFASDWLEEVAAALVHAWRRKLPDAHGSTIVERRIRVSQGVAWPSGSEEVVLAFESPVEIRYKNGPPSSAAASARSLLSSIANRVSGLARWQDASVDPGWQPLAESAGRLDVAFLGSVSESWSRRSFRQNREIPMRGDRPLLKLSGDLEPFLPWLALGAEVHAGSHAALGMGRYKLLDLSRGPD